MDFKPNLGRRIRNMGRLAQITNVFARHGFWSIAERMGIQSWLTPEQVRRAEELSEEQSRTVHLSDSSGTPLPARLRLALEELGPTFVKFGQVLATRQDLMSEDYIAELRKLHSNVAPLPFGEVKAVLDAELGERMSGFSEIEQKPIAAGSIAQVHRAVLSNGDKVAVKIQRPGIRQQMEIDLSLMEEIALLAEKFIPELRFSRPSAMVREFGRALSGELDFVREGGNITKISRNLSETKGIVIPKVYWKLSSPRVLTQSFLEGLPAWDREKIIEAGIDPTVLVERGLGMFLKMVFVDGLYHGDLHPGNLLAMSGDRVGVLDFGLAVHLSRSTRENLAHLLVALVQEDFERVVLHYVEMADPPVDFDTEAFEYDVGNAVVPFMGLPLEDMRSGAMFWDLAKVAAKHGCPMPLELIVFVKTLSSFEGIGTHLDPEFNVLKAAEKFSAEITREVYSTDHVKNQALLIARDLGQLARHAPYQVRRLLKAALAGELNLNLTSEDQQRLATVVDRSSARLAVALMVSALIIGSSILVFAQVGRQLYSMSVVGLVGFSLAGILGFYVVISIIRGNRL